MAAPKTQRLTPIVARPPRQVSELRGVTPGRVNQIENGRLQALPAGAGLPLQATPFDLAAGDIFRAAVTACGDLYLAVHHAAFDGLSEEIFTADLAVAYGQALTGCVPELKALTRPAPSTLDAFCQRRLAEHWTGALAGVADLPADGPVLSTEPSCRSTCESDLRWPRVRPGDRYG